MSTPSDSEEWLFRPPSFLCIPGFRSTHLQLDSTGATLSEQGVNSCAARAFERHSWHDVVLLRGALGARSATTLLVYLFLAALAGGVAGFSQGGGVGGAKQVSAGVGAFAGVFLLLLTCWLFDRRAAFGVFAQAPSALAPPPFGLATAAGSVEPAVAAGVRKWFAARGGPGGDPFEAAAGAQPASTVTQRWCGCLCAKGQARLEGRPAAGGGGGAFFTHTSAGLCNLDVFSAKETAAFLAKDVQYLRVVAGGRTRGAFAHGLLLLAAGIGMLSEKSNERVQQIGAGLLLLGVLLLARWWLMQRVELTFGLTEALAPSVELPSGREDALWGEAFAAMAAGAAEAAASPAPVTLEGVDQFGSMVTLTVDGRLARVKTSEGAKSPSERFCCAACVTTETFACRTSSLQFAHAASTDMLAIIFRQLAVAAVLIAIAHLVRSAVVYEFGYAVAAIMGQMVAILVIQWCKRRTTIVVGTVFTKKGGWGQLAERSFGLRPTYPYRIIITPAGANATSDAGEIVKALGALIQFSKGAAGGVHAAAQERAGVAAVGNSGTGKEAAPETRTRNPLHGPAALQAPALALRGSPAKEGPPPPAPPLSSCGVASVLHNFDAAGDADALTVRKGERVVVLGGDGGWVDVRVEGAAPERRGVVPASYVRLAWATALHDFTATDEDTLSVRQNQRVVVVAGEDAEGWVEVHAEGEPGRRGLVPAAYIRHD